MSAFWDGITNGFRISLTYNLLSSFSPYRCGFYGSYGSAPLMMPGGEFNFFQCPSFNIQAPIFDFSLTQLQPTLSNYSYNSIDFSKFSVPNDFYKSVSMNFTPSWNFSPNYYYAPSVQYNNTPVERSNEPKIIPTRTANELYQKWSKKDISKDAELTPEFCEKVIQISKRIKCDPDDLMAIMYHESRFSPKAKNEINKGKNAGLIQFGARTRKGFGLGDDPIASFNAILNMSAMKQLDYVEEFYLKARKNANFGENDILTLDDMASIPCTVNFQKRSTCRTRQCSI